MVSLVLSGSKVCDFQILQLNKDLQDTVNKPTFQALILERVTIINISDYRYAQKPLYELPAGIYSCEQYKNICSELPLQL